MGGAGEGEEGGEERVMVDVKVMYEAGKEFGSLQHLDRRAERWRDTLVQRLADTEVIALWGERHGQSFSAISYRVFFWPP